MDVDPAPSPNTVWESQRSELNKLRDENKDKLAPRAMDLLDHVEDLVFDLLPAFPSGVAGAEYIIGHIDQVIKASPRNDAAISSRMRLFCVFARSSAMIELSAKQSQDAMETLMSLDVTLDPRPKWLSAYFLAIESIMLMAYTVSDCKVVTDESAPVPEVKNIINTVDFGTMPEKLLKTAVETLGGKELSREETMAALRIIVILTRHDPKRCSPELLRSVLTAFKPSGANLTGCYPLLAMIARHAFDDKDVLRDIMRREIRVWMNPERNKVTDVSHFVRQLRQMAYRDANTFLDAAQEECELTASMPASGIYQVRHKNSGNKDEIADKKDKKDDKKDDAKEASSSADPFKSSGIDMFETSPIMNFFIAELGTSMRAIQKEEAAFRAGTPYTEAASEAYAYAGLILSLLTELVGSYFTAKKAFMAAVRHGGLYGKGKSGLSNVINDLACCVTLGDVQQKHSGSNNPNEVRRLTLSSWAMSLLVALCANVTHTTAIQDLPEDLILVRKAVLDGVAKVLKDTSVATPEPGARYGRLWALGELIYRLLTARLTVVPTAKDDSSLHLAKTMLEKNFVSLMTLAVSEIDLNYPDVRNVLVSLLRALEHLTKISIKWGKTDNKQKDEEEEVDEDDTSLSEEDSDISMTEDEGDEGADLYRNSALGILGGDIDIDDEDDDMDEDDLEDEEDMVRSRRYTFANPSSSTHSRMRWTTTCTTWMMTTRALSRRRMRMTKEMMRTVTAWRENG